MQKVMLESDILTRTEGLSKEHYEPLRLLHLAHIANDQVVFDLGQRKEEWQALVDKADMTGEPGMYCHGRLLTCLHPLAELLLIVADIHSLLAVVGRVESVQSA